MLKISFLACTKVELWGSESFYCSKSRKISKSHHDIDLFRQCPISNLSDLFSYTTKVLKFHVPKSISF